jgi:putative hemolysin
MLHELIIIFVLILLNGLFSMSEIALVSAKKTRLELLGKKGSRGAQVAAALHDDPTRFLSTVQIGITVIGIITGIFSGAQITENLTQYLQTYAWVRSYASTLSLTVVVVFVTYLTLVFGELLPKKIGMVNPESIASVMAVPMQVLSAISKPFVDLLSASTKLVFKLLNLKIDESRVTEEEILALIDEGQTKGTVEKIEQNMVQNIFYLGDKRLESLMTHISDVVLIKEGTGYDEILDLFRKHRHSLYPVYKQDRDQILGVISIKDVLAAPDPTHFDLSSCLKPIHFFPEHTKSYKVLETFMDTKTHQGIIVDEFGSVLGLITMKDLLNDLIGNLSEEEPIAYEFIPRDDTSWLADGLYPFVDFLKLFDLDTEPYVNAPFHTIAGFFIYQTKKLPVAGDTLLWNDFKFEVVDMDHRRVDKLIVSKMSKNH